MKMLQLLIGSLCIVAISTQHFGHNQWEHQNACQTPLGDMGTCVSLRFCPQVVNLFTKLHVDTAKEYSMLLRRSCGLRVTSDNYPVVCCTQLASENEVITTRSTSTSTTTTTTTTTTPAPNERVDGGEAITALLCQGPGLEWGVCHPLQNCTSLLDRARNNPTDESFKEFLKLSNKNCGSVGTNVCCPRSNLKTTETRQSETNNVPRRLPSEDEGCGFAISHFSRVVGGQDSHIGAWPWIALIGYDRYSLRPFRCGGTLITARHVITAAHCFLKDLSFVRLGEFDLSTDSETPHVDIDVDRMVKHPNFGTSDKRNDIGVLFLARNVEFTDLIRPICMPVANNLRSKNYVRYNPFVAGWGRINENAAPSNVLQQVQIPVLENSVCRDTYRNKKRLFSENQFDDSVLCAGVLEGGKDSCYGDSGGPLMLTEPYKGFNIFYLIGIVSYGIGCAQLGTPGVYTSTQHFMDWINEQIAGT